MNTGSRWKWRLVSLLDRSPGWCWSTLVSWVMFDTPLTECRRGRVCYDDAEATGACYCGRVRCARPGEQQ